MCYNVTQSYHVDDETHLDISIRSNTNNNDSEGAPHEVATLFAASRFGDRALLVNVYGTARSLEVVPVD
jgi:hypothetical protein